MEANEFTPTDNLELLDEDQDDKVVAHLPIGEALIPRTGELIVLHTETGAVAFRVTEIQYHYGIRSNDGPNLLAVKAKVKTR